MPDGLGMVFPSLLPSVRIGGTQGGVRMIRLLVVALLLLNRVPTYAEWAPVGDNDQEGMAVDRPSLTQSLDRKPRRWFLPRRPSHGG